MRVLIGCEFSGIVRDAFRAKGHNAYSCDLLYSPGPYHLTGNIFDYIQPDTWDLMICFPPCTFLCNGSLNWINRQEGRKEKQDQALEFCKKLMAAPIDKIAMENPIGKLSTRFRKPDQIFRVWQFGHPYTKDVCLWLKGLEPLKPTHTDKPKNIKTFDFHSKNRFDKYKHELKAITFQNIALEMAKQWG